jgi:hypothetical protein
MERDFNLTTNMQVYTCMHLWNQPRIIAAEERTMMDTRERRINSKGEGKKRGNVTGEK